MSHPKHANFFINQASFLRCVLPLAKEANKRNYKINFFVESSKKYNDIMISKNMKTLLKYAQMYNADVRNSSEAKLEDTNGVSFFVENVMLNKCNPKDKKIVVTTMTDFSGRYKKYIENVDHVIFPSKKYAEIYNALSEKNMYFGMPKYDVIEEINSNRNEIFKKYNIDSNNKNALFFYPRLRDERKIDINKIIEILRKNEYNVIVKSRGKDRPNNIKLGDLYYEDISYHPHTSLELLSICDLVVNFSSTCIKESIMFKKPIINYHIKPFEKPLAPLYNFNFAIELAENLNNHNQYAVDEKLLHNAIKTIENQAEFKFEKCIDEYLFKHGKVSEKIFDKIEEKT